MAIDDAIDAAPGGATDPGGRGVQAGADMRALPITPLLLGLLLGCPSSGDSNPATLWLANDMVETRVKLVDVEPEPF